MSGEGEVNEDRGLTVKDRPGMLVISEEVVDTYMQASQMLTSKFKEWLIPEVDFTTEIFGRGRKPSLLDPGAGKLIGFFACRPRHRILERFYSKDEEGYESIRYVIATEIVQGSTGKVVAEGIGSCSSDEKRYKYRWFFASELEKMGVTQEERHKLPTRKTGGGATQYRARNPETPDLDNTILKMASKRSEVDGCLQLPGVAAVFTQDVGDYKTPEGQPKEVESEQVPPGGKSTKKKTTDSDKVKEIKAQAKRDREERLAKEEGSAPPEPEEETPAPSEEPESEEEEPPQEPSSGLDGLDYKLREHIPDFDKTIKLGERPEAYLVYKRDHLSEDTFKMVSEVIGQLGGSWSKEKNRWEIPKEAEGLNQSPNQTTKMDVEG